MSAAVCTLNIEQGAGFRLRMRIKRAGVNTDLTRHKFSGQLRKFATSTGNPAASFRFEMPPQVGDTEGVMFAFLDPDATLNMTLKANTTPEKTPTPFSFDIISVETGPATINGTLTQGSPIVTACDDLTGLYLGQTIVSDLITAPQGMTIVDLDFKAKSITLSVTPVYTGPTVLTVTPKPRPFRWLEGVANISPASTR